MAAGTALVMLMVVMVLGVEGDVGLHGLGDGGDFTHQGVGVFCRQPQLLRGEYDDRRFHFGQFVDPGFDLGGAVGAAEIFYFVDLLLHKLASFNFYI